MKICKTLIATGRCKNVDCKYAHSREEIQAAQSRICPSEADSSDAVSQVSISEAKERPVHLPLAQVLPERGAPAPAKAVVQPPARWFGIFLSFGWCPNRHHPVSPPCGVQEHLHQHVEKTALTENVYTSYRVEHEYEVKKPEHHQFPDSKVQDSQFVVKNTFIEVVESSAQRAAPRSASEPPRRRRSGGEARTRRSMTCFEDMMFDDDANVVDEDPIMGSELLDEKSRSADFAEHDSCHEELEVRPRSLTWTVRNTFLEVTDDAPSPAVRRVRSAENLESLMDASS